jgi:hypothetical protein
MQRLTQFAFAAALALSPQPLLAVNLQGRGAATVDGVRSAHEWDAAGAAAFAATLPGGGSTPAVFYVMNDGTNLYLGLALAAWNLPAQSSMELNFDNNDNGVCDSGEDALAVNSANPTFLNDDFWGAACSGGGNDTSAGGTLDGSTQVAASGAASFWEMAHPLNDADDAHDFSLAVGNVVGFSLGVTLCGVGCVTTYFPASAWGFFGEITIVPADWIFVDGFEAGDRSAWSSSAP